MKRAALPLLLLAFVTAAQRFSTGYDQTGGVHLWGPNGLDALGAFRFQDICTPGSRGREQGQKTCYQIKVVLDHAITGFAPDIVINERVYVWGDPAGHFWWECGDWRMEMINIEETIRAGFLGIGTPELPA
jgi:hypothetical protein